LHVNAQEPRSPGEPLPFWGFHPVDSGEEIQVLDKVERRCWDVAEQGLCFLNRNAKPVPAIEMLNFATKQITHVASLEKEIGAIRENLPVGFSRDGRWILYARVDQIDNGAMIVDNFR